LVGTVIVLEAGAERSQGRGARRRRGAGEWHLESEERRCRCRPLRGEKKARPGAGARSGTPDVRAGRGCGPIREEERGAAESRRQN
jgi:hypothetical protein